ncbi:MAG: hypothetical protein GVY18_04275 [Bacteroidetes bacterium]|jgi:hypothetical protein|nr:hypothetical protein [Bacteroidota bacterium]
MLRTPTLSLLPLLAALLLLTTGCTQTRDLAYEPTGDDAATFDEANAALQGHRVDITLDDGRTMPSVALAIAPDSTAWIDLMTDNLRTARTEELLSISHTQTGRGAIHGTLFGAGVGTLLGVAAGVGLLGQQNDDALLSDAGFVSRFAVGGLLLGSGVGLGIGTSRGAHDRYVYPDLQLSQDQ